MVAVLFEDVPSLLQNFWGEVFHANQPALSHNFSKLHGSCMGRTKANDRVRFVKNIVSGEKAVSFFQAMISEADGSTMITYRVGSLWPGMQTCR